MSARKEKVVSDRVRIEWTRRIEAEYRSAAITQHLTLWLIQLGASPTLIRAGLRIVSDELHHAALSHKVAHAAGAEAFVIDRRGLQLSSKGSLEENVLYNCVSVFCLGETVAVPLFKALRQNCSVPRAKKALDRILVDEVRHREFGWTLLDWLIEMDESRRAQVQRALPELLAELNESYGKPMREPPLSDEERAWGLMPAEDYRQITLRCLDRDYRPRFRKLQLKI